MIGERGDSIHPVHVRITSWPDVLIWCGLLAIAYGLGMIAMSIDHLTEAVRAQEGAP